MKKILVIGSANADLAIRTDRMPMPGETVADCIGRGDGFSA